MPKWEIETVHDDVNRREQCAHAIIGKFSFIIAPSDMINGYDWFAFLAGDNVPVSFGHSETMQQAQRACEDFR